jgi:hypothetical protein
MPLTLIVCHGGNDESDEAEFGPGGGRPLRVGNHELTILPAAVPQGTKLRIVEPVSNHIEVTINPNTQFQKPCILTLSYARCGGLPKGVNPHSLTIVEIEPGTTNIIGDPLTSSVQPGPQTVRTVVLTHVSGYAIAIG